MNFSKKSKFSNFQNSEPGPFPPFVPLFCFTILSTYLKSCLPLLFLSITCQYRHSHTPLPRPPLPLKQPSQVFKQADLDPPARCTGSRYALWPRPSQPPPAAFHPAPPAAPPPAVHPPTGAAAGGCRCDWSWGPGLHG